MLLGSLPVTALTGRCTCDVVLPAGLQSLDLNRRALLRAGDRYDGEFREGQEDGIGIFTWADGATYNGFWAGGAKAGVGVYRPAQTPENKRATTPMERHTTQPAGADDHSPASGHPISALLHDKLPRVPLSLLLYPAVLHAWHLLHTP